MNEKRRDNKGRILHNGEIRMKDGRYRFKYIDDFGKVQVLYSWRLDHNDPQPRDKKSCLSIRELEKQVQADKFDHIVSNGGNYTVLELVEKYIQTKTGVRPTTQAGYRTTINFLKKDPLGRKRIDLIRISDAKCWLINLQSEKGKSYSAIAIDPCYISKSGKKTPGIDWFWSGCAAAMKKGLEILGISIVDADVKDAVFLKAEQTFTEKQRGRKPRSTWGMKDPDSLTGWYLRMLQHNCKQLLSICNLIVADAYFSKESFVTGVKSLGFNLISRFRDDVNLKYLYRGPKAHKRGRPQKFSGKVDVNNLDMTVFKEDYCVDGKLVYKMYWADVWAVSLEREVRVVIVDYLDTEKKRQTRKSFFCTDLSMSARDIFDLYRTRFQIEFVFRDAKQFTGLTHCQARNKEALAFAFNMSLSSINVARAYARQENVNLSVGSTKTLLHNAAMVDRFIAMSGKRPNMRLNNTDFKELLFYCVRAVA